MQNLVIFLLFASMTYGCTPLQVYNAGKIFCDKTTAEWRAEVRTDKNLPTNICGDELK